MRGVLLVFAWFLHTNAFFHYNNPAHLNKALCTFFLRSTRDSLCHLLLLEHDVYRKPAPDWPLTSAGPTTWMLFLDYISVISTVQESYFPDFPGSFCRPELLYFVPSK